jgi:hypothetical protein
MLPLSERLSLDESDHSVSMFLQAIRAVKLQNFVADYGNPGKTAIHLNM